MPAVRMSTFNKQVNDILKKAGMEVLQSQVDIASNVLRELVTKSPVFTGYYASNHRVLIRSESGQFRGASVAKLVPASKPPGTPKDAFVGNIGPALIEELSKLFSARLGDEIVIATEIPYSDEVERNHGVYSGAAALFSLT